MISSSFPRKPAFLTRCLSVYSFVQFSQAATSGKKVAEQCLPLNVASITIPCLPTSQSNAFFPYWKLTKRETPTLRVLTQSNETGSKRSSCSADIKAYFPNIRDSCECAKVPMHPLRSFLIIHVTKIGTFGSGNVLGYGGSYLCVNLAIRTSKQYLQCYLVACGPSYITYLYNDQ